MAGFLARDGGISGVAAQFAAPAPGFGAMRAHLPHEACAREVDVGQTQRHKGARGVLGQTAIADLREAPLSCPPNFVFQGPMGTIET